MLDRIFVNLLYLVPLHVHNFRKKHPNSEVIIADGTKARRVKSNEEAKYEMGWMTARRTVLILTEEALYCGDWNIPLSNIVDANLLHISGGSLLKISTMDGLNYQFGIQRNRAWEEQEILPLTVQSTALNFSRTSIVLRLLLLAWLAYISVKDYLQNGFNFWSIVYLVLSLWIVFPMIKLLKYSNFSKSQNR